MFIPKNRAPIDTTHFHPAAFRARLLLIPLFMAVFVAGTFAQEGKPALAVLDVTPVNVEASKAVVVYGYIIDQLKKWNYYTLVERREIDKALKEIEFSLSDLVDDKTAVRIGKFTGARYVLISSLSLENGVYYLSVHVVETETARVVNAAMKKTVDFSAVDSLVAGAITDVLGQGGVNRLFTEREKAQRTVHLAVSAGAGLILPLPDASRFLNLTVAPAVFVDVVFVTGIGLFSVGVGGSFDYYTVKDQPDSWVMNIPIALKVDYLLALGGFYLFAGAKGGLAVSDYRPVTVPEVIHGFVFFVSPELGAGLILFPWLGVSAGANLDMFFFNNGDLHLNVTPFVKITFWL